ncbi:MAG: flagellar basal body-associated FliL family protein [Pseudohongiella sp.]|nr:flagellar basal body-associated FliL family protein [Pseudohongiella sp.]MDO9520498.1 flagellar basal body-associated FliL family protein [Pseudohongiella sp.]MDP2126494.1 flagellar basal body-associated FliL family protein [Pseudohongiella sp.]
MRTSDLKSMLTIVSFIVLLAALPGGKLLAADAPAGEDDPASGMAGLIYYTLGPSFVTNYDGAGRLKYLKADIAVRIDPGTAPMLDTHLPYIRNKLVVLLAAQLEENLTSTQGKEMLRNQALNEVKAALDYVQGSGAGDRVRNLYFTSFVVQR